MVPHRYNDSGAERHDITDRDRDKMDRLQDIKRLQQEQRKAIRETDERIAQLEKFKKDYVSLCDCLTSLPEKITHDVMVPFGKLSFMPGQLVHTNEVTVLLGDNWFVDRSAKQATQIVNRRISGIVSQVDNLKRQKELLLPRLEFTSQLHECADKNEKVEEIVEEYSEEKENEWRVLHKENVRRYKDKNPSKQAADDVTDDRTATEDAYLTRLDELECEETSMNSDAPTKTVKWSDQHEDWRNEDSSEEEEEESEDDDSEEDDSEDNDREDEQTTLPSVINFRHTVVEAKDSSVNSRSNVDHSDACTIQSPADIYREFTKPKSILKPQTKQELITPVPPPEDFMNYFEEVVCDRDSALTPEAVGAVIVERDPNATSPPLHQPELTQTGTEPKHVSKFKARRLAQAQR